MDVLVQTALIVFGLLNLAFACVVYAHNRQNIRVVFYALISVFASLWSISTLLTDIDAVPFEGFKFALYGHYIFGYMAYLSFFWFTYLYPQRSRLSPFWPIAISLVTIAALGFVPTGLFFTEITDGATLAQSIIFNELGYKAFIVMLSVVFFLGLIQLVMKLREAKVSQRYKELDRNQIYFLIVEFLIAGSFGIILNLVLPLYGNFSLFYVNPIFVTVTLIGIGLYTLNHFHIFNAKVILAEFFAGGMVIMSIARLAISKSTGELVTNGFLLLGTVVFSVFLIQSVMREVAQREQIQKLAEGLKQANERLKELDKMKSQFLSIASHDLRAPLTVVRNFLSLLMDGTYGKLPAAAEEGMRQVFDRATDMAKSIDAYLNVSRIEQGRMKYDFIDIEFAPLVENAVKGFLPDAEKKGLTVSLTVDPMLKGRKAKVDVAKMNEVLNNLLDNSIKYTPKGSIAVHLELAGSAARFTLTDTGVGMSQETIQKLFKLFSTGAESLKVNTSSTGVGLYITKAHVEAHKGRIWAESDGEGRGSRFIFELPLT